MLCCNATLAFPFFVVPSFPMTRKIKPFHAQTVDETAEQLAARLRGGLTQAEAERRLSVHGPNRLPEAKPDPAWRRLLRQFDNALIYVLLAAVAVTAWLGEWTDAAVIFAVVLVSAILGAIQEGKAQKALEAVKAMLPRTATVIRDGERRQIAAEEVVPGDLVFVEGGMAVPADLRLVAVRRLAADESTLTGESLPVEKQTEPVSEEAPLAERRSMLYAGTTVVRGQGVGLAVATGADSEIGHIGRLVAGIVRLETPLTRRLDRFARGAAVVILAASALLFAWAYWGMGQPLAEVFLAVVGIAVAAIPEGLPAIVTIILAIGGQRLAQNKAIVRRLPAVETLGSVTVICTDKTGTLTRNELTVTSVLLPYDTVEVTGVGYEPVGEFVRGGRARPPEGVRGLVRLARAALLCNDAALHADEEGHWVGEGDPLEVALLVLALKAGLDPAHERTCRPRLDLLPFEAERRWMATLHRDHHGNRFIVLKGAPEAVFARCDSDADGQPLDVELWHARLQQEAEAGRRLIAFAWKRLQEPLDALCEADVEGGFEWLGVAGLVDPPRPEAKEAIRECHEAGIRVVMITGDHPVTARAIGGMLGLRADTALTGDELERLDDQSLAQRLTRTDVVARAAPEHKLRLVRVLQGQGHIVAMTGDGANDAPALQAADIGVAMGRRGTDAARQAAAMVLADDNFATLAEAVRWGRVAYDNIKKAMLFVLPVNVAQALVVAIALAVGWPLPITAAQILWVNLVTAVTLSVALAFELPEDDVMRRPPRPPAEPLMTPAMIWRIVFVGALVCVLCYGAEMLALLRDLDQTVARTAATTTLVAVEIAYLFNCRRFLASAWRRASLKGNVALWPTIGVLALLQIVFVYAPPLQFVFRTTGLDLVAWGYAILAAFLAFLAVEVEKAILRRTGRTLL